MSVNFFLQIERSSGTVDSETTEPNHEKWIEILAYSTGHVQPSNPVPSASGGRTVERAHFSDLSITKFLDITSPTLALICSAGETLKTVTLHLLRAADDSGNPYQYMEYIISDCIISSYSVSGSEGSIPVENITFNYTTINWKYDQQSRNEPGTAEAGPAATGWDLQTNRAPAS